MRTGAIALWASLWLVAACSSPQTTLFGRTSGSTGAGTSGSSGGSTTGGTASSGSSSTAGGSSTSGTGGCGTLFAPAVQIVTGVGPTYPYSEPIGVPAPILSHPLAVGDLNGDGNLDIAIGDWGNAGWGNQTTDLGILLGNGDGSFQSTIHFKLGGHPSGALINVLAKGGTPALAIADASDQEVGIFSFSSGGLTLLSTLSPAFNCKFDGMAYLSVADFNGDGWPDVLVGSDVASGCTSSAAVYLGSNAGWTVPWLSTDAALPMTVGDFDGDGILDLVMATSPLSGLAFLRGKGDGTFDRPVPIDTAAGAMAWSGDLNGDGHLDLLEVSGSGSVPESMNVLLGAGDGTFTLGPPLSLSPVWVWAQLIDLNGDGKLDFVWTVGDGVKLALGNGDGSFQPEMTFQMADPTSPMGVERVVVGDVNNDGLPDLIVGDIVDGNVSVFLNTCKLGQVAAGP